MDEKIYSQAELDKLLMGHRRGLQRVIRDQQIDLDLQKAEIKRLSVPESNPVVVLILDAIRGAK